MSTNRITARYWQLYNAILYISVNAELELHALNKKYKVELKSNFRLISQFDIIPRSLKICKLYPIQVHKYKY